MSEEEEEEEEEEVVVVEEEEEEEEEMSQERLDLRSKMRRALARRDRLSILWI